MQYLAQWRMQLAGSLLAESKALAAVAEAVGYGSEAAFSRAFKKIVGVALGGVARAARERVRPHLARRGLRRVDAPLRVRPLWRTTVRRDVNFPGR